MASPPLVELAEDEAAAPEGNVHGVPERDDEHAFLARITQLEEDIAELQSNLAAEAASAQRAITSDGFMLAEVQRASKQLLSENLTLFSMEFYAAAWLILWFSCSCSP